MKKVLLTIGAFIIIAGLAGPASAVYNIHLSNGSIIKGVKAYEERNGQILLSHLGGTIAIPASEVYKIEEDVSYSTDEEPTYGDAVFYAPEPMQKKKVDTGPIKKRISTLNVRLHQINLSEADVQAIRTEYDRVRLRIEVLFQKGRKEAIKQGGNEAEWFKYLDTQNRKWAQLNTLKKRSLKTKLANAEQGFVPFLDERKSILTELANLEDRLDELEN